MKGKKVVMNEHEEIINTLNNAIACATEDVAIRHFESAIKALEEVQQYRAIGTPEELKQLKENGAFTGIELAQIAAMQMELKKYMEIGTVDQCSKAMDIVKAMIDRGIEPENVQEYIKFEDECVKNSYTIRSLLESRKKIN